MARNTHNLITLKISGVAINNILIITIYIIYKLFQIIKLIYPLD